MLEKCEFCEKWGFENMNFVKNEISEMWILSKRGIENVNFVKNEILKMWILSKMIFSKCEFLDTLRIFAPVWRNSLGKNRCVKYPLFLIKTGHHPNDKAKNPTVWGREGPDSKPHWLHQVLVDFQRWLTEPNESMRVS